MEEARVALWEEGLSERVRKIVNDVRTRVNRDVIPLEQEYTQWHTDPATKNSKFPKLKPLKEEARKAGLWNLGISRHTDPTGRYGARLSNAEYSFVCQELGRSIFIAPEIFNCGAPGTPDAEVLIRYGTEEQKKRWLPPITEGQGGCCFAMTEPSVASSDANNIASSITRDGDHYAINGRKWWISASSAIDTKFCLFLGRTNPAGPHHRQHSIIIVPMDTPGISIVRDLTLFGYDEAPKKHAELVFENVRVPVTNLLYEEGRGFEIGQARLGPARVHHCMRIIGATSRAVDMMAERAQSRVAFGQPLSSYSSVQQDLAKSRVELEQARLLVLKTAHIMDVQGNRAAAADIAAIKLVVPKMACTVLDRAIQVHGGLGVCQDTFLPHVYALARGMRIFDGPDEVHCRTIAGNVYQNNQNTLSRI